MRKKKKSLSRSLPPANVDELSIEDVLGTNGLLSQSISGFTPRDSQKKMAAAIQQAFTIKTELIVEAGTGTGKTYGYLVPVFLAQKKTIISTGTKNLQDQLFFKDIPVMKKIFSFPRKVVLLKGRANYLCHYRLDRTKNEGRLRAKKEVGELYRIVEWAYVSQKGDIDELTSVPEDSNIWSLVTSTTDNCLNQACAFYKDCFLVKARKEAMSADIIIVNHHLFFADLALQEEGFGELLPEAKLIIFDEAHHIPEIASQFFSTSLSARQLIELARDAVTEAEAHAKDVKEIEEESEHLQAVVDDLRLALGSEIRKAPWPQVLSKSLENSISLVKNALQALEASLKQASVRSKGLESCNRRAIQLIELFDFLTGPTPANTIHWFETFQYRFLLQLTPMLIAEQFLKTIKERKASFIFTSATLTVNNSFALFVEALGLHHAQQLQLKSPFNYQKQALLYVPRMLPDPRTEYYIEAMIQAILPVLMASAGRAFLLFTSYHSLDQAAKLLENKIDFPLLIQGSMPKRQLIEKFKKLGNAILLGTSSFWFGVDVRGEDLSCVIIDKLPFAAPEDPLLKARIQNLRKQGVDPFTTYQLPHAVLILKQGAGRLIRDTLDRGILVICDPRLVGSRYGETFIKSLPDMPRTREIKNVLEFFATP